MQSALEEERPAQQTSPGSVMESRREMDVTRSRSDDSWVEVSSRPSSSSLSSSAAGEIVTDGLTIQRDSTARRRRRRRRRVGLQETNDQSSRRGSFTSSSQEEYDESESESDHVLTSSTEGLGLSGDGSGLMSAAPPFSDDGSYEDDEATTLGAAPPPAFVPSPNIFTHPLSSQQRRQQRSCPAAVVNAFDASQSTQRTTVSLQNRSRAQHTPYNAISPSYQFDHDAALKASLSTLLSCAAAARGLPKVGQSSQVEPTALQIVPERVLLKEECTTRRSCSRDTTTTSRGSRSSCNASPEGKGKRKASISKDRRTSKKTRHFDVEAAVPTLTTWIVSAGVVVLFSAIGFSTGYVMGREVGRAEGLLEAAGAESASCGREVMRGGIKRLRWTGASGAVSFAEKLNAS